MAGKTLKLITVILLGAALAACSGGNKDSAPASSNNTASVVSPSPTAESNVGEEADADEEAEDIGNDTAEKDSEADASASSQPSETAKPQATAAPATDKPAATQPPAEKPKPTATAKPAATAKPQPTAKPSATAKPTATVKPSTTPDGGASATDKPAANQLTTAELMEKIVDTYKQPAQIAVTDDMLTDLYRLDASLFEEYTAKMPMMNVKTNEIAIFKLKNASDASTVEDGIKQRAADVQKQFESYLPDQYENAKNYKLVTNGSYILFVISDSADDIVGLFNDLLK